MFNVFGQARENEIKLRDKLGNPKLIEFKETKVANQAPSVQNFLKQQFKGDGKSEFRSSKDLTKIKGNNSENQKFHQYYNGIKVEHGRLSAISKNGNLTKIVGRYVDVKNLNTVPALSEQQALNSALAYIKAFTGYGQVSGLVQVWGKNACGNGGAKLLSVSHGTGGDPGGGGIPINGFAGNTNTGVSLFPNPVNDQLHFVFTDSSPKQIKLFSFQGVLLRNLNVKSNTFDMEVSSLPNGIYLLEIRQGAEKVTEKIIVQH